jgi:S1-C subfamily serine protease
MNMSLGWQRSNDNYARKAVVQLLDQIGLKLSLVGQETTLQLIGSIYVAKVDPAKAASKCGIREKDVILEINDHEVGSWIDVEKVLYLQTPAKPIRFLMRRYDSVRSLAYMAVWYE